MKKLLTVLLALSLLAGVLPLVMAETPSNAGQPSFDVDTELEITTTLTPDTLAVYPGQAVVLVATTTYTSNKGENQWLHFVSDSWLGVDAGEAAQEVEIEADPAAGINEKQKAFVAKASLVVADEPGEYDVAVTYTITLQHDQSGKRVYTTSATLIFSVTVMEGPAPEEAEEEEEQPAGQPLNHGQIVSTWAHWKQTKGNKNFMKGGPGVYRSLNWYKTQVEYKTFYSKQEVWDYLESIYEPAPRDNGHPGKGNPNKNKPGKNK